MQPGRWCNIWSKTSSSALSTEGKHLGSHELCLIKFHLALAPLPTALLLLTSEFFFWVQYLQGHAGVVG